MADSFKFPDEQDDSIEDVVDTSDDKSKDSDDFEVEVIDDTPDKDKGRKPLDRTVEDPTDDEINSYSDGVQKRIKELTHARHDERRAKEALAREKAELETVARKMIEENKRLRSSLNNGQSAYAESMQQVANNEVEAAKRALKEANESFDTDAIIAAQEQLFEAKIKLDRAKNFRPAPLQEPEDQVQTQPQHREAQSVDEKTLRWQARNQWFGAPGHEEMTSFALGLHQKLVNAGVEPSSDEYFDQINDRMKSTFRDFFGDEDKPKNGGGSKRPATVVAPATRSSGVRKVQMTSTQVALAKKLGLTPQQYAAEIAKLEKSNG